ncbi:MAG: EamA family transporter RarD [Geobacter sp.]|nr:MAG: EamA family transporter RarD [Geobacter sp.]
MYGLAAYLVWGFFPLYFKAVQHVPPLEVVSHRIVWSMLFLALLVTGTRRWREIGAAFRTPKTILTLSGTTLLIAANWLIFIFAVEKGEVLQSSLGYFMNPLVNVFLGFALLGERLRRWQTVSLVLAASGVLIMSLRVGQIPWIALLLAVTFGLYGLLRKTAVVDSLVGLSIETFLAAPAALAFLCWLGMAGKGAFLAGSLHDDLILPLAGVVTAVPLLWFTAAARRLRLATMGFLQYITPSIQFILAVWAFGEKFTPTHLIAFSCIWGGLALYSWSALVSSRRIAGNETIPGLK